MLLSFLESAHIDRVLSNQSSLPLVNSMGKRALVVFPFFLYSKETVLFAIFKGSTVNSILFEIDFSALSMLTAVKKFPIVHFVFIVINKSLILLVIWWSGSKVCTVLVLLNERFAYFYVKGIDQLCKYLVHFLHGGVLVYLFGTIPILYYLYFVQLFDTVSLTNKCLWYLLLLFFLTNAGDFAVFRLLESFSFTRCESLPPYTSSPPFIFRQLQFLLWSKQVSYLIDQKSIAHFQLIHTLVLNLLVDMLLNILHVLQFLYMRTYQVGAII